MSSREKHMQRSHYSSHTDMPYRRFALKAARSQDVKNNRETIVDRFKAFFHRGESK